jgi:hypothetical protein
VTTTRTGFAYSQARLQARLGQSSDNAEIDRAHASGPVLTVVLMGGEQSNLWLHLEPVVADYARARGCVKMQLIGRRGWSRVLKHWRQVAVVMENDLEWQQKNHANTTEH